MYNSLIALIRHLSIALVLSCFGTSLLAQETIYDQKVGLFNREQVVGAALHTNAISLNYRYGKNLTGSKIRIYEIAASTLKHPKEYKIYPPHENSRGYFYGKVRSLYTIQPAYGHQKVIFDKIRAKGVEIRTVWFGGFSLGLSKPIYLEIRTDQNSNFETIDEAYDPEKHEQNIYGRSRGVHGLSDINLHPGLIAKVGLNFEYSGLDETVRSLEIGAAINGFITEVPLMAIQENKQTFVSLYANLLYGKKYYR